MAVEPSSLQDLRGQLGLGLVFIDTYMGGKNFNFPPPKNAIYNG
jgi:hypothetical protein